MNDVDKNIVRKKRKKSQEDKDQKRKQNKNFCRRKQAEEEYSRSYDF